MGDFFEGTITFWFKLGNDDFTRELIQFIYDFRIIEWESRDAFINYLDYLSKHDDIISEGLKTYKTSVGDARYPNIKLYYSAADSDNDHLPSKLFFQCFNPDSFNPDRLIECYTDEDGNKCVTPTEELNYDYMINKTISELGVTEDAATKENAADVILLVKFDFDICELYNADEHITKLIDLWSPYLYEDYIGTIKDENHTFVKDYYRYNIIKCNHHEFCGDWCNNYSPHSSCTRGFCKRIYELGVEKGKSGSLSKEE